MFTCIDFLLSGNATGSNGSTAAVGRLSRKPDQEDAKQGIGHNACDYRAGRHRCRPHRSQRLEYTLLPLVIAHQRGYGDIFVNLGPMHANALAYQPPMLALLRGGIAQSRESF